jgi:transposase
VLCDGGYRGENFAKTVKLLIRAEVVKRNELHRFVVLPQRWVVERSLGGWKSFADFGRTANGRFIPPCK